MRVIKIGGRVQGEPGVYDAIAAAWQNRAVSGDICLVHGGGDEVSQLQRLMGIEPAFIGGRRVTRESDIDILRMGLSGASNKRIVAALQNRGVTAVGISGEDATLIGATRVAERELGMVGTPASINGRLLTLLLDGGFLPVISPMGRSIEDGSPLNINGDDAAAAIAASLDADELLLVADVNGVLENGSVISVLTADGAAELVRSGSATGGMIAKLESALQALSSGVKQVRIGSTATISGPESGTIISLTSSVV